MLWINLPRLQYKVIKYEVQHVDKKNEKRVEENIIICNLTFTMRTTLSCNKSLRRNSIA